MRFEVFTRISPGDDTIHIGSVDAQNERLAKIHARHTYDEEDWDFIAVVRQDNFHEISTSVTQIRAEEGKLS